VVFHPLNPIPLLDYVGTPVFLILFGLLLFLQWKFPLRRSHFSVLRRLVRNYVFSFPAFVLLRLTLIPIPLAISFWAAREQFGLLHWIPVPGFVAAGAAFLLMDWAYYWWHYANHFVPFFWRFHNVHHTDLDLDVTTAARFHFGEILFSIPFRMVLVAALGVSPLVYLVFEIVFESASLFHHSNWRLSLGLERFLNHMIVTPRMHGIHHSIVQGETNSNWGTIFCWWDKIHRSLRRDVPQSAIIIGVPAYRDEDELTLGQLWTLPFKGQRAWKLPDGAVPNRPRQPAAKLAD
jgi:sterol desaturase/sphingolipid hydroxylase (fatty acid hydroxylase superfamily)